MFNEQVGELAKFFLWDPFFPVHLENTLVHVLLLLSKHHRLQAVHVVEQSNFQGIGHVTQVCHVLKMQVLNSKLHYHSEKPTNLM